MKTFWIILVVVLTSYANRLTGSVPPGGGRAGMGYSGVVLCDLWAVASNQAGMAWLSGWQAGIFIENRYLMKELTAETVGLVWCGKPGAFGVTASQSGFSLYREIKTGLAYARKFGRRLSAGVEITYFRLQLQEGYGGKGVISCEAGLLYRPDPSWSFGFHVSNPVPVKITALSEEWLPTRFRMGLGYSFEGKAVVIAEAEKDLVSPVNFHFGTEVRLNKRFQVRAGLMTLPFTVTGGVGFRSGILSVDIATSYHSRLGFSPSISLSVAFQNRKS